MNFEIQGLKCKTHLHKLRRQKRFPHLSKNPKLTTPFSEAPANPSIPRSKHPHNTNNSIIFSSDLPNLPLYMPKLISRTQTPLKPLSQYQKARKNIFSSPGCQSHSSSHKNREKILRSFNFSINSSHIPVSNRDLELIQSNDSNAKS